MNEIEAKTEKLDITDRAFRVSLYLKGLDGFLELLIGVLLLLIKPDQIIGFTNWLVARDPDGFITGHVQRSAHHITGSSLIFGALYMLSHGIVKVVLVVEVLRDRLWAYVALIAVTAGFVIYQLYLLLGKLSAGLILLTLFDLLIIYLTQKEYKKHKVRLINKPYRD